MKNFYGPINITFFICLIFVVIVIPEHVRAQWVGDYNFTAAAGTFEALSEGIEIESIEADETISSTIPIGFDFWYIGSKYNQLRACSNGYIALDNYNSPHNENDLDGSTYFTGNGRPAIAPLWDDLDGNTSQTSSSKASYKTTGTYPNRVFTFEWLNWQWGENANEPVISFQVKLYEIDGKIEFIYRQESGAVNSGSASIGITDYSTGANYFLSLDGTGSSPNVSHLTETKNLNTKPATGQIYRFTPAESAVPSNLTFTNVTKTAMKLNWTDNSNNENGFVIYHSTDNVNFEYQAKTSANVAYVTIDKLETGISHYWKVYSKKGALSITSAEGSQSTLNGTISGIKTIGSSPSNYTSISEALFYIGQNGLSGSVILELKSNYNSSLEWTFPISFYNLGASQERTITIRPAAGTAGLTITNSENSSTIDLDGEDHIIIDGRPGGIGTNSGLTIENTNSSGSPAVRFSNDASHNQIKYCRLKADNPSVTSGVIQFTETNIQYYSYGQRYNSIENCEINGDGKSANGIYSKGNTTTTHCNKFNTLSNNNIHDFYISGISTSSTCGINIFTGNSDWTVTGNNIYQTSGRNYSSTSSTHYGIIIYNDGSNFNVENNAIGGSAENCGGGAWNVTSGNFNFKGIYVNGILGDPGNIIIKRNKIANFSIGSSTASISGIKIDMGEGSAYNNFISLGENCGGSIVVRGIEADVAKSFSFYYNTVYLAGTNTSGSNNSYAFVRNRYASVILLNNIFYNGRTGGSGHHYAIGNILTEVSTNYKWPGETSNYNLLVSPNSSYVGMWGNSSKNFTDWKSISGGDNNSISETTSGVSSANLFVNAASGDLHINAANEEAWFVNGKGCPVSVIMDDYDGASRSSSVNNGSADIGADEFIPSSNPPAASVSGLPANNTTRTYTNCGRIISSINWGAAGTVPNSVTLKYYSGTQPPGGLSGNYSNCYWEITPDGGSGYVYDLTFHYDENQLGSISSEGQIKIAKRDGGNWQHLTDAVVDVNNNTVTITGLNSFSQFTLSDQSSPLPVELSDLTVNVEGFNIQIKWNTATEINSYLFTVQRKSDKDDWADLKNVEAAGNSNSIKSYEFIDEVITSGRYFYRLKMIDNDGSFKYSSEIEASVGIPGEFKVSQNYPNPFNPLTKIDFQLPFNGNVKVVLCSITGEQVKTILDETLSAGYYNFIINGNELCSGIYFCCVTINDPANGNIQSAVKKIILLK